MNVFSCFAKLHYLKQSVIIFYFFHEYCSLAKFRYHRQNLVIFTIELYLIEFLNNFYVNFLYLWRNFVSSGGTSLFWEKKNFV
jgi:hypothetical protein